MPSSVSFDDMRKEWIPELSWKLVIDAVLSVVFPIAVACLSKSDANGTAIRIISIMVCVCSVAKIAYEVYMYLFEKASGTKDKRTLHDEITDLRSEIAELRSNVVQGQSNVVQGQSNVVRDIRHDMSNVVLRIDRSESNWEQGMSNFVREMRDLRHDMSNLVHRVTGPSTRPGAGNASLP